MLTIKPCRCGRYGVHCPICGRVNFRALVRATRDMELSGRHGMKVFRCNRCGTEFTVVNGVLFEPDCHAQSDMKVRGDEIQDPSNARDLVAAMELCEKAGIKLLLNGEAVTIEEKPKEEIKSLESLSLNGKTVETKSEALPEGWSLDAEGRPQAPVSLDDLIKPDLDSKTED